MIAAIFAYGTCWAFCLQTGLLAWSIGRIAPEWHYVAVQRGHPFPKRSTQAVAMMSAIGAALNNLSNATMDLGWYAAASAALAIPGSLAAARLGAILIGFRPRPGLAFHAIMSWVTMLLAIPFGIKHGWSNAVSYFFG